MRKTVVTLLAVLLVFSVSVASANVSTVKAGQKADCLSLSCSAFSASILSYFLDRSLQ